MPNDVDVPDDSPGIGLLPELQRTLIASHHPGRRMRICGHLGDDCLPVGGLAAMNPRARSDDERGLQRKPSQLD